MTYIYTLAVGGALIASATAQSVGNSSDDSAKYGFYSGVVFVLGATVGLIGSTIGCVGQIVGAYRIYRSADEDRVTKTKRFEEMAIRDARSSELY